MGFSLSWLAVKGRPPQAIRDGLAFRLTDMREEIPESELSGVEMPNGWYLIVSNHISQVCSDSMLDRLSSGDCEIVTCSVEEHVMTSHASGWRAGRMTWSVTHDAQLGERHLEISGEPPPEFAAIRDDLSAKQSQGDCDYMFDIPVETAKSVVGYRHNEDILGLSGDVFVVLEAITEKKPSFFKRLFGS